MNIINECEFYFFIFFAMLTSDILFYYCGFCTIIKLLVVWGENQ